MHLTPAFCVKVGHLATRIEAVVVVYNSKLTNQKLSKTTNMYMYYVIHMYYI